MIKWLLLALLAGAPEAAVTNPLTAARSPGAFRFLETKETKEAGPADAVAGSSERRTPPISFHSRVRPMPPLASAPAYI